MTTENAVRLGLLLPIGALALAITTPTLIVVLPVAVAIGLRLYTQVPFRRWLAALPRWTNNARSPNSPSV